MFNNSGLQKIPYSLLKPRKVNDKCSITINGDFALQMMFNNCTDIESVPSDLFEYFDPEQTGRMRTCANMFASCTGLKGNLPDKLLSHLPAGNACFTYMFTRCANITGIGERFLSPKYTEGAQNMCDHMFASCSSLVVLPTHLMATDTPTNGGISKQFYQMFYNCSSITEIPEGFLSNSVLSLGANACEDMFSGNDGCGSPIQRINAFLPFTSTTEYGSSACLNMFGTNEKRNVSYIDPNFFNNLLLCKSIAVKAFADLFINMGIYYNDKGEPSWQ
ncbi:MAG: hypothetical protein MJ201_02100 [Mycoplasmoidaceae bacterium]|nr:hypothetical protein [Mycoplasmoidaceae bacterium]